MGGELTWVILDVTLHNRYSSKLKDSRVKHKEKLEGQFQAVATWIDALSSYKEFVDEHGHKLANGADNIRADLKSSWSSHANLSDLELLRGNVASDREDDEEDQFSSDDDLDP